MCNVWTRTVSDIHIVTGVREVPRLQLGPQRLTVCYRTVPQAAEGQRHTYVAHTQLSAGQLKQLGGPVRAAGRPALAEHKEGILHQHLHTHL